MRKNCHIPLLAVTLVLLAGAATAQTPIDIVSGGLKVTALDGHVDQYGRLYVSYLVTNVSPKTFRLFIQDWARAGDNLGHNWKAYNMNDAAGIWSCMHTDCFKDYYHEVEQNATIMAPGDRINLNVRMVGNGKIDKVGTFVSVGLSVHSQDIKIDDHTGAAVPVGSWTTKSLGVPNIPIQQN